MRIYLGAMLVVCAIAVAGCGGGDDEATAALTKAQFIKQGDAICSDVQKKQQKAIQAWSDDPKNKGKSIGDLNKEELGQLYLDYALPPMKEAADKLAALSPPAKDEKAEKFVEALESAVERVEENPLLAIKAAPFRIADRRAQAYGFETCGIF